MIFGLGLDLFSSGPSWDLKHRMRDQYVRCYGSNHLGQKGSNVALAMFTFPSMALHEECRTKSLQDPECQAAFKYAEDTRCIISYERSFFRPVFE